MRSCTQRRLWRWLCVYARRVESVTAPNTRAVRPSGLERRTQLSRVEEIPVLTQHPTDSRELARAGAQVRLTLTRPRAKPAML